MNICRENREVYLGNMTKDLTISTVTANFWLTANEATAGISILRPILSAKSIFPWPVPA